MGLDLLDGEVFAAVLALATVAGIAGAVYILEPPRGEPFLALAVLGPGCSLGGYPDILFLGQNVSLCIFISNGYMEPVYVQVRYKLAAPGELPSREAPSPAPTLYTLEAILAPGENRTIETLVPVERGPGRLALVFELWRYDPDRGSWLYTGRWVHVYVEVHKPP